MSFISLSLSIFFLFSTSSFNVPLWNRVDNNNKNHSGNIKPIGNDEIQYFFLILFYKIIEWFKVHVFIVKIKFLKKKFTWNFSFLMDKSHIDEYFLQFQKNDPVSVVFFFHNHYSYYSVALSDNFVYISKILN